MKKSILWWIHGEANLELLILKQVPHLLILVHFLVAIMNQMLIGFYGPIRHIGLIHWVFHLFLDAAFVVVLLSCVHKDVHCCAVVSSLTCLPFCGLFLGGKISAVSPKDAYNVWFWLYLCYFGKLKLSPRRVLLASINTCWLNNFLADRMLLFISRHLAKGVCLVIIIFDNV